MISQFKMVIEQGQQRGLDRRDFLKYTLLAAVGYTALNKSTNGDSLPPWHRDLRILPPQFPLPSNLGGIAVNFPYLSSWLAYPGILNGILEDAGQIGANYIRVFISDKFESELGGYEFGYLENVAKLSEKFPLQVEIIDGYKIFHSDKHAPSYSPSKPESPYLLEESGDLRNQRLSLFKDGRAREKLIEREFVVARFFNSVPGVIALSIGNEIEPPVDNHDRAQELMMELYPLLVAAVREAAPQKPLLSGVGDPTLVVDLDLIDTIHIYPEIFSTKLEDIFTRLRKHPRKAPFICQEIGFPSVLKWGNFELPIPFNDRLSAAFIDRTLAKFVEVNEEDGWKRFNLEGVVLWRLTYDGNPHRDGFGLIPKWRPLTMGVVREWQDFYTSNPPANNVA